MESKNIWATPRNFRVGGLHTPSATWLTHLEIGNSWREVYIDAVTFFNKNSINRDRPILLAAAYFFALPTKLFYTYKIL